MNKVQDKKARKTEARFKKAGRLAKSRSGKEDRQSQTSADKAGKQHKSQSSQSRLVQSVEEKPVSRKQKLRQHGRLLATVIRQTRKTAPGYLALLVLDTLAASLQIALWVFLPKLLLDAITRQLPWDRALYLVGGLALAEALLKLLDNFCLSKLDPLSHQVQEGFQQDIARKISHLPYSSLEDPDLLKLKEQASFAIVNQFVVKNILDNLRLVLQNLVNLILLGSLLCQLSWLLLAFLLACFGLNAWLGNYLKKYETNFFLNLVEVNRKYGYYVQSGFDYDIQQAARIYDLAPLLNQKIEEVNREICDWLDTYKKKVGQVEGLQSLIISLQTIAAYGYAGLRVLTTLGGPRISLGSFTLYAGAAQQFSHAMQQIFLALRGTKQYIDYLEPYQTFMALPELGEAGPAGLESCASKLADPESVRPELAGTKQASEGKLGGKGERQPIQTIEFQDVSFTYPGTDQPILQNVSFRINQGEKISIVGLNGAGKTTLVKLLCHFFKPSSGKILINGQDLETLDENSYLRELAAVFQDFRLLPFSIQANVASQPDEALSPYAQERIKNILAQAGLGQVVADLPEGMRTLLDKSLNEGGTELSGGQAQKLAIARALYKDGSLVILDEPTSALDPLAEAEIYEHFDSLVQGQTALYISHRMASSRFCDKVLVLNEGRVEGFAPHEDLIQNPNSLYTKLFQEQAQYYKVE